MKRHFLVLAAAGALAFMSTAPAMADGYRGEWRRDAWREHAYRRHEWREWHRPYVYVPPPRVYYAPPRAYYPPPAYYGYP